MGRYPLECPDHDQEIARLANLGRKFAGMLKHAGITSEDDVRRLGSVRCYLQVKRAGENANLNLLWALEGFLGNKRWQDVAREDRLALLSERERLEKGVG